MRNTFGCHPSELPGRFMRQKPHGPACRPFLVTDNDCVTAWQRATAGFAANGSLWFWLIPQFTPVGSIKLCTESTLQDSAKLSAACQRCKLGFNELPSRSTGPSRVAICTCSLPSCRSPQFNVRVSEVFPKREAGHRHEIGVSGFDTLSAAISRTGYAEYQLAPDQADRG
jgi:hypothetical protein